MLSSAYFRFYSSYTPYIYGVVPHGIAPGDEVTLYGDFQWSMLNMAGHEPEDPRGYIREVKIGEFLCVSEPTLHFMITSFKPSGDCLRLSMQLYY